MLEILIVLLVPLIAESVLPVSFFKLAVSQPFHFTLPLIILSLPFCKALLVLGISGFERVTPLLHLGHPRKQVGSVIVVLVQSVPVTAAFPGKEPELLNLFKGKHACLISFDWEETLAVCQVAISVNQLHLFDVILLLLKGKEVLNCFSRHFACVPLQELLVLSQVLLQATINFSVFLGVRLEGRRGLSLKSVAALVSPGHAILAVFPERAGCLELGQRRNERDQFLLVLFQVQNYLGRSVRHVVPILYGGFWALPVKRIFNCEVQELLD